MNHIIKNNHYYRKKKSINVFAFIKKNISQQQQQQQPQKYFKKKIMTENDFSKSFQEFEWLTHYSPQFQVKANDIEILSTPIDFYNCLKV